MKIDLKDLENLEDDDDDDFEGKSDEEILKDLPNFSSIKLCDIIVAYRYLGFYKKLYIPCMEELSRRRVEGDSFDFEKYIETSYAELPKINFNLKDFSLALVQLKKLSGR